MGRERRPVNSEEDKHGAVQYGQCKSFLQNPWQTVWTRAKGDSSALPLGFSCCTVRYGTYTLPTRAVSERAPQAPQVVSATNLAPSRRPQPRLFLLQIPGRETPRDLTHELLAPSAQQLRPRPAPDEHPDGPDNSTRRARRASAKATMDKRKVNGGPPAEELDDRAAKRRKMPGSVGAALLCDAPRRAQTCARLRMRLSCANDGRRVEGRRRFTALHQHSTSDRVHQTRQG